MTDNREVIEKKAGQDIKSIYDLQLTWVKDEIKVNTGGFEEPKYSISNSYKLDNIDVWNTDSKGLQMVNENKLIIPLIKAVQELSAKVDAMQIEINNLK